MQIWCGCWRGRAEPVLASSISRSSRVARTRSATGWRSSRSENIGSAIADAVCERDLEAIGRAALSQRLSVGASGLGLGLARGMIAAGTARRHEGAPFRDRPIGGPAACLAGSCSQATLEQIDRAEHTMAVLRLDPDKLVDGRGEIRRALDWAAERMAERAVANRQQPATGGGFPAPGPPRTRACRSRHRAGPCDDRRGFGATGCA